MRAPALVIAACCACQLDTSGTYAPSNMLGTIESSGDDDDEQDDTAVDDTASTSTSAGSGSIDGTDGGSSGDAVDPTDSSGGSGEGTTAGLDDCASPVPFALQITADQAFLVAPMTLDSVANGTPYVYSATAGSGTATFTFDVPCPDEYYFHGFVYDAEPGPIDLAFQDNGADSYAVAVGGATATWNYGCQTGGVLVPNWQWQPVMDNLTCVVDDDKVVAPLLAGTHTIAFQNLEAGTNAADTPGTAAAIAVLSITNDPNYSP